MGGEIESNRDRKLLCDEMLSGLGRWLRIAGYDTEIATPMIKDEEILDKAISENRILLTRDRHFLEIKKGTDVVLFLQSNSVEECALELGTKLKINWLKKPFSRCSLCNHELYLAKKEDLIDVPMKVLSWNQDFLVCPFCKKVYWKGCHADRMLRQLEEWQKKGSKTRSKRS